MTGSGGVERLEVLSVGELLQRMDVANRAAADAVRRARPALEQAVDRLVQSWRAGGRLIYVGAGTSGRIGVLDAVECEPTFGVARGRVVAVVAGGSDALARPAEGAEDDEEAGAREIDGLEAGPRDLVVGISASGSTAFTCGALRRARARGAGTIALSGGADTPLAGAAELVVLLQTGAELVEGSTRLKAATAQKMACNALTTAAFIRLGRVAGRHMVAVRPTNRKLRARAAAILAEQSGLDPRRAEELLEGVAYDLPCALVMTAADLSAEAARAVLASVDGDLPRALAQARADREPAR